VVRFHAVIEIPAGSRNKYEIDHESGEVWLDRHLFVAMNYPLDYGFIPETLAEDGDPVDVMVLLREPTFPGCNLWVRPVAVFWMLDEAGPDAKILCAVDGDPRWDGVRDMEDLDLHLVEEITHFFDAYKTLEPNKHTETRGWEGSEAALAEIEAAQIRFRNGQHHPGL
jgi:inorganic pyrophosphatase